MVVWPARHGVPWVPISIQVQQKGRRRLYKPTCGLQTNFKQQQQQQKKKRWKPKAAKFLADL